ncbi:hypothetical protein [Bacteriovorax sp. BSW11_IV]|uniref:hypothetical protein n=1 Tax=Bacteriovorax sp. BSW11_IV TaxID=1353529 RepID=UPI0003F8E0D4|nr:hypothetical protein [Bacteriovorax sp. BSW11_IV]
MKNKIALINFPSELDVGFDLHYYYKIYYLSTPITEFVLTQFQAIIVFDPKDEIDTDSLNFFSKINKLNVEDYKNIKRDPLLFLDNIIGREMLVNPRQFEILQGSVVKSKIDGRFGPGLVKEVIDDYNVAIHFTNAKELKLPDTIKCHKSTLRVITHIKEIIYHERNKFI